MTLLFIFAARTSHIMKKNKGGIIMNEMIYVFAIYGFVMFILDCVSICKEMKEDNEEF